MPFTPQVQARLSAWKTASHAFAPLLRGEPGDWDALRDTYVKTLAVNPTPDGVFIEDIDMGGIPGTVVTPADVETDKVLMYIHGGGYAFGSPAAYHGLAGNYALGLRARVFMPAYRLAPQHPFPAAIDDALSAYTWLLDEGEEPSAIALAGDCSGGAMVVSVMVMARNAGLPLPAAGVAISPWANLEHTGTSMRTRDGVDPTVTVASLNLLANAYLNGTLKNDPEASPVFADVRGLPPILVQVGESEVMLSDAMRLAQTLAENRVRVSLEVWPHMFHSWPMFSAILPEGMQAVINAVNFIDEAMSCP